MSKLTRWIQVAGRAMSGKGPGAIGPLEKAKNSANNTIQQRYRIPNAVQLGHTLPCLNGGKDRSAEGTPIAWPGLCIASHALPNRGSILEICSPGLLCRTAASHVALAESRLGQVLWLSIGAHPELAAGCGLDGVRNLTLRRWPIATAADSRAALQHLLGAVRSQTYSLVVLDHVAGLAPPLTAPGGCHAAPASAAAGAVVAAGVAGAVGAAPGLVGVVTRDGAAAAPTAAAASSGDRVAGVHMKFLHHILPVLLEDTLSQLAASCGSELGTTTLLLNTYSRPEQAWFRSGGGGSGGERRRWARRAIVRHASATLHLLPDGPGGGGAAAAQRGSHGDNGGGGGGGLHAVLTKGTAAGEDGEPCFMGSLKLPVRHSSADDPP